MESGWDESVVLDLEHFRDFTAGDESLEREVLGMFMGNVPEYIGSLLDIDENKWPGQAHLIKGAARAIGAWNLAVQAERLEHMENIPAAGSQSRQHLVADLSDRLAAVEEWIEAEGLGATE